MADKLAELILSPTIPMFRGSIVLFILPAQYMHRALTVRVVDMCMPTPTCSRPGAVYHEGRRCENMWPDFNNMPALLPVSDSLGHTRHPTSQDQAHTHAVQCTDARYLYIKTVLIAHALCIRSHSNELNTVHTCNTHTELRQLEPRLI